MTPTPRYDGQDGFTLIELLVAMSLSIVILIATLNAFDVFSSNAAQQQRTTAANDQARLTMDRVVRDMRGASTILTAAPGDLAYAVPEPTGFRTERLCVSGATLYASTTTGTAAPVAPSAACASGGRISQLTLDGGTAFTYDGAASSATPANVKNVGLTFSLDASGGGRTGRSVLRASAAVRKTVARLAIDPGDVKVTCAPATGSQTVTTPAVQLAVGTGLFADAGPLTITYVADGTTTIAGGTISSDSVSPPAVQLPQRITRVLVRITNAAGVDLGTVEKAVGCV